MKRNVEIKAELRDRKKTEAIAKELSTEPAEIIRQHDVLFPCGYGRMKLRIFSDDRGEFIAYDRPDQTTARISSYHILPINQPHKLREVLETAIGIAGEVKKVRTLYLVGPTRVHLDRVDNLGDFIELEVVLRPEQTEEAGKAIADDLAARLDIHREDLIPVSYIDLLNSRGE